MASRRRASAVLVASTSCFCSVTSTAMPTSRTSGALSLRTTSQRNLSHSHSPQTWRMRNSRSMVPSAEPTSSSAIS